MHRFNKHWEHTHGHHKQHCAHTVTREYKGRLGQDYRKDDLDEEARKKAVGGDPSRFPIVDTCIIESCHD